MDQLKRGSGADEADHITEHQQRRVEGDRHDLAHVLVQVLPFESRLHADFGSSVRIEALLHSHSVLVSSWGHKRLGVVASWSASTTGRRSAAGQMRDLRIWNWMSPATLGGTKSWGNAPAYQATDWSGVPAPPSRSRPRTPIHPHLTPRSARSRTVTEPRFQALGNKA